MLSGKSKERRDATIDAVASRLRRRLSAKIAAQKVEILKRLEELNAKRNSVGTVRRFGNRLLYLRRAAGENTGKIVLRNVAGGAETTVLDLEKMSLTEQESYAVRGMKLMRCSR